MIYQPEIECASREEIEAMQLANLKDTIQRCYNQVPHYKKKFGEIGLKPEDIQSLADLAKIPFTVKDDLRDNYPYGMFAVPLRDVVRIHASSGTTGTPTVVGYTQKDLEVWATLIARLAVMAGASADDVAQIAFGYGMFTGALGLHYGLEKLGCTIVPVSAGNSERQIKFMKDFGTTLLISTPSYALYLNDVMEQMGIDPKTDLKLRIGMFGGEGITDAMDQEIQDRMGILPTGNYGLSEVMGPGVSGECEHKAGLHVCEDSFILEIIDPHTGEVLPMGAEGELVISSITREALPILRYRTRDITHLIPEKCACGRTSIRMAKIKGRSDSMLIIRGVNVFPSQIEEVLMQMTDVAPHYEIVVRREGRLDVLEVLVEVSNKKMLESFAELEQLENKIRKNLKGMIQVDAKVKLVEPHTLKRFEGKSKRVTDLR